MDNLYWHGLQPFVEFTRFDLPWRSHGSLAPNPLAFEHRKIFMPNFVKACEQWCIGTALIKEGPKSIILYRAPAQTRTAR